MVRPEGKWAFDTFLRSTRHTLFLSVASSQIPPPWDSGDTNSTGFKQSWMASLSWKELKVISWERNRKRGGIQIGSKKTFYGS